MRSSILALTVASLALTTSAQALPEVTAAAGSLGLGAVCSSDGQCAIGRCFGSTAGTIRTCGSFNAPCASDAECATNTCSSSGICSGFLASSLYRISRTATATSAPPTATPSATLTTTTASAQGMQPAPVPTIVAADGSLPLGAQCAATRQCAAGAECFASTAWQIKSCGKFNAACTTDAQCATNSCNNGLCNGFQASSSAAVVPGVAAPTGGVGAVGHGGVNATTVTVGGGSSNTTSVRPTFTGAAAREGVSVAVVLAAAVVAWAL